MGFLVSTVVLRSSKWQLWTVFGRTGLDIDFLLKDGGVSIHILL